MTLLARTRTHLSHSAFGVLETLSRLRFATRDQLLYWSELTDVSSIGRITNKLVSQGLVTCIDVVPPRVYGLTDAGYKQTAVPPFRRRTQFNVVQHYCHRNAVEITLRQRYSKATFQSRHFCLRHGLLPARGEHLFTLNSQFGLALIDDQLMHSARIERSWLRIHKPDQRDYQLAAGNVLHCWRDAVQQFYVFSTDVEAVKRHQHFVHEKSIPATVDYLQPIWGRA